jgi:predicted acyl esterase
MKSVAENLRKTVVGPLTHKAFTWSSPEFMSYVHQGLVEMRKAQASTLGALVKKREYKELLSSSKAARRKQSRRCVVSRC